ncbi:hypothetical protein HJC99_00515 [Candidatus Saccharibacteria bacterium]|nr:hypothetical protein [Candidatus Saccharibacteria bacterium]
MKKSITQESNYGCGTVCFAFAADLAFLYILFAVTMANFVAQIPYYLHQYYLTSHTAPSPLGLVLMGGVLAWFLIGYHGLARYQKYGYILVLSFLSVEFLFYLQTQIAQYLSGHGIFLYVSSPHSLILFIVFGVGYINFIASAWFIYELLRHARSFVGDAALPLSKRITKS